MELERKVQKRKTSVRYAKFEKKVNAEVKKKLPRKSWADVDRG
jgi:hypothetical protein